MIYQFKTTPTFRRTLNKLSREQKRSAKVAFQIFKKDPFDVRLKTHKIHHLSAHYGRTVYAVWVEGDLRVVFYLKGNTVVSLEIGTHSIYR